MSGRQFIVEQRFNSKCKKGSHAHYFKLTLRCSYLQMSGMVLGGMIEADWRLRQYENQMRMQRRWMREKAKWQRYEEEFGKNEGNK